MAWFRRGGRGTATEQPQAGAGSSPAGQGFGLGDDVPETPVVEGVPEEDQARIKAALAELESAGVDVDDLASIGAGLDAAFVAWESTPEAGREPHDRIVERFAFGIGEHLHRHTDLRWQLVTDAFGTDLAVADGMRGGFVVVPMNLVAVRWLRREQGWVPGVVGHLVQLRTRR
jgi:hypothetical protein